MSLLIIKKKTAVNFIGQVQVLLQERKSATLNEQLKDIV